MKKLHTIIKPYLAIVFGALLLLIYLNWLAANGATLAMGIIAVVFAAFYLTAGILGIVLVDKLPESVRKVFSMLTICLFPIFMFIMFLLTVINANNLMGPTAWTISILSMIGSLGFVIVYLINVFAGNTLLSRLTNLFGLIFILVLLLNVLFDVAGNPVVLGNVDIIGLVLYALYVVILVGSFSKDKLEEKEEQPEE